MTATLPTSNTKAISNGNNNSNEKTSSMLSAATVGTTIPQMITSGTPKLPLKTIRVGPSPFRQLMPFALCIISFAAVLSLLILYMDTTEIRHQQFRLNMSRDYELYGVPQDNPSLISYVREVQMRKYPMTFLRDSPSEPLNTSETYDLTPELARFIGKIIGEKERGIFVQSLTGPNGPLITGPWLAELYKWGGVIVEPDPRKYFNLRKQNAHRPQIQIVHACLSSTGYPKEVTYHYEDESEVRINSLVDEDDRFLSRVKCFPLYTLMLAINNTNIDLLSLGFQGHEFEILQTIPFDKVNIKLITIHLVNYRDDIVHYVQNITKFLFGKSYKLIKTMENTYIYQRYGRRTTIL